MHVSAVNRCSSLYEHMEPELVGNGQRILITELGGRSNIVSLARRFGFHLDKDEPVVKGLFNELKKKGQPRVRLQRPPKPASSCSSCANWRGAASGTSSSWCSTM